MDSVLLWLEGTSLATFVRESSSIWAYPTILFMHTLGLGTVAGLNAALNLRVLGFGRKVPLATLTPFITVIWIGFVATVASGSALIIADASTKLRQPVFYVKLVFVALALVTLHRLTKRVFRNPAAERSPLPRDVQMLAIASLLFWAGATTAGRLMAYII